jgi:hypothetical protein
MKPEWKPHEWQERITTDWGSSASFEELYQAMKERLKKELLVDAHGLSNYGRLIDESLEDVAP